jgi:hypothetical protein
MEPFPGFAIGLIGGTGNSRRRTANGSPCGAHHLQQQVGAQGFPATPFQLSGAWFFAEPRSMFVLRCLPPEMAPRPRSAGRAAARAHRRRGRWSSAGLLGGPGRRVECAHEQVHGRHSAQRRTEPSGFRPEGRLARPGSRSWAWRAGIAIRLCRVPPRLSSWLAPPVEWA